MLTFLWTIVKVFFKVGLKALGGNAIALVVAYLTGHLNLSWVMAAGALLTGAWHSIEAWYNREEAYVVAAYKADMAALEARIAALEAYLKTLLDKKPA